MTTKVVLAAIVLTMLTSHLAAQSQPGGAGSPPAGGRLTFEVASIKRNVSGDPGASVRSQPGGRVIVTNNSLYNLIRNAYNAQRFEMVPGKNFPDWIDSDRWDITAQARDGATQPQMMQMMQSLLVDRFALVVRREMREMPVYALVLDRPDGRLGPQLRRSDVDCAALAAAARPGDPPPVSPAGSGPFCGTRTNNSGGVLHVAMHGIPLANFVRNLSAAAGRFVVDKTGLTGPFELELKFTQDQGVGGAPPTEFPSLFAALPEQLGLRLEAQKAPVEVLVIDSAERPTDN